MWSRVAFNDMVVEEKRDHADTRETCDRWRCAREQRWFIAAAHGPLGVRSLRGGGSAALGGEQHQDELCVVCTTLS